MFSRSTFLILFFTSILTFICCIKEINAQEEKLNIYSGGMLLFQPAYVTTSNPHTEISTLNMGIGGILRFYPFRYLTAGIYGGSMKGNYQTQQSNDSYISLGYGGVFGGFSQRIEKLRISLCFFTGKGSIRNLHIEQQSGNILTESYLYRNSTLVLAPLVSLDYSLSNRIVFTTQLTYFIADKNNYNAAALQLGILFVR